MDVFHFYSGKIRYSFYRSVFAPVESNMYILLECNEAIVFDAIISDEALNLLKVNGIENVHIFLTHEHYDHSHGILWLKEHFNTILYCHKECKGHLSTKKRSSPRLVAFVISVMDMNTGAHNYDSFQKSIVDYDIEADEYFEDDQTFCVCSHEIRCIYTPGHTPGSSVFLMDDKLLFSGDSLIEGNRIITGFKGGDKESMINVTLPRLKSLSGDLIVLPGHGKPFKKKEYNFNIYDNV